MGSNTGGRYPGANVTMYGAPPAPKWDPPDQLQPYGPPFVPLVPHPSVTTTFELPTARKLRVSVRREDSGEMKIKIMVDGEVIAEGISDGTTLTIEKEI